MELFQFHEVFHDPQEMKLMVSGSLQGALGLRNKDGIDGLRHFLMQF